MNTVQMATVREDFLTEDVEIPGQKYVLLSFLSPEKVLSNKDVFMFEKFLSSFEYTQRVSSFEKFLMTAVKSVNDKLNAQADLADEKDLSGVAQTIRGSRVQLDVLMNDFQNYVKENRKELTESKLKEMYDDFLHTNREKLEEEFYVKNEFQTTVRGLKVRGVYNTNEEAVMRSKKLQRNDTIHNIFVGEIGKWLPWDPAPSQVANQEYAEDKLNTLMKKYKENEEARESYERETRTNMLASSKKGTVTNDVVGEHGSLFSGDVDLALARKMEGDAKLD